MPAGRIHRWWLLLPGVAGQAAADHLSSGYTAQAVLVGSYAVLGLFLWTNRMLVGVGLLAAGLAANAVVVVVDVGMPVRASAIVAAGLAGPDGPVVPPQGARHHLEGPDDQLVFLDDHLPVRALHRVISYGDVLLTVGALDVVARMALPGRRRRPVARAGGVERKALDLRDAPVADATPAVAPHRSPPGAPPRDVIDLRDNVPARAPAGAHFRGGRRQVVRTA